MRKITCFIVLAGLLLLSGGPAAAGPKGEGGRSADSTPYKFAVIPYYTPEKIWTLFSPFVEYLSRTTGVRWELHLYHNHDEFIEDLCQGKISMALAGPVPLGRAFNACGVRPFLVALSKKEEAVYHSVLITADPDIKTVPDLKGKKVGFFKGSTAAHIMPVKMLKQKGVAQSYIVPVFLESQDRLISALMSGDLAAAGVKEALYLKMGTNRFRVLATSDPLPNFALCASPSLPAKVRDRTESTLLRLKPSQNQRDAETVKGWDDEVKNGFVRPSDEFMPAVINLYSTYWEVTNESR